MAAAAVPISDEFVNWLKLKLIDLNTDDEVFSPYIIGILEADDSNDDKLEALEGILSEIIDNGTSLNDLCAEILKKWTNTVENAPKAEERTVGKINVDEKLAKLMEESKIQPLQVTSKISSEEQKLKQAILAQYGEISDGEVSDDGQKEAVKGSGLMKNTNAECVLRAEREKRDKEKEESQKKKEKDKEDRAKQKSKEEERKEKEKKRTQKGERRR